MTRQSFSLVREQAVTTVTSVRSQAGCVSGKQNHQSLTKHAQGQAELSLGLCVPRWASVYLRATVCPWRQWAQSCSHHCDILSVAGEIREVILLPSTTEVQMETGQWQSRNAEYISLYTAKELRKLPLNIRNNHNWRKWASQLIAIWKHLSVHTY